MADFCLDWIWTPELADLPKAAHSIEPLEDPRWDKFVESHPHASVFHSKAWLTALSRSYGYKPVAYTTSSAGHDLENALVFCRVESWLTGRRLVSLPFSDHCEPLVTSDEELQVLTNALEQESRQGHWSYMEMRPLHPVQIDTPLRHTEVSYAFHQLDLTPSLDALFHALHKDSTQRKIRRAERERLIYCEGSTPELLNQFYELVKITRKRHNLPPQSRDWFATLMECCGEALKIRVALKGDRPVAAMLTIRHRDTMMYKYGCSDSRFNNLGGMHLLFWESIKEAKASGLRHFDFGRTDAGQDGLITFKNRWGATQSALIYSRYGTEETSTHAFDLYGKAWKSKAAKYVMSHFPPSVLSLIGRFAYRHVG
jgi:lipid II:glycine glycyltransferase (peptidoglycan interpeptide bridge formation enzyme)